MNSIARRLIVVSSVILVVFLSLAGVLLERTYSASVISGAREQLKPVIYSLLGSAQEEQGQLSFADGSSQPRLQQPNSGLYARVTDPLNGELWRSPSLAIAPEAVGRLMLESGLRSAQTELGSFTFATIQGPVALFCLSNQVLWDGLITPQVTFNVCVDQEPYQASIKEFRRNLVWGFGFLLALLSLVLLLALSWGLRPLRQIQHQLQELERGDRGQLDQVQPQELAGLVASLNGYVSFEAAQRKRYRQALDDLAHSLKTPLSVLGIGIQQNSPDLPLLQEQVGRMQSIVDHQLTRVARVAQTQSVADRPWVAVRPVADRLIRALGVSYPEIDIQWDLNTAGEVRVHEDDLLDILGNLLENACKYGAGRVVIFAMEPDSDEAGAAVPIANEGIILCIADDGPGIEPHQVAQALDRGARLDSQAPGQGIGLAMVADLAAAYEVTLSIEPSDLGGVAARLHFPYARSLQT